MKNKKTTSFLLVIACVSSLLIFSGCKQFNRKSHHDFALDYVEDLLDLTEAQKATLKQYEKEVMVIAAPLKEEKAAMHALAKQQLASDEIDIAKVKEAMAEHQKRITIVLDLTVEKVAAFHKELTPEQRKKLIEKLDKFEKYHSDNAF